MGLGCIFWIAVNLCIPRVQSVFDCTTSSLFDNVGGAWEDEALPIKSAYRLKRAHFRQSQSEKPVSYRLVAVHGHQGSFNDFREIAAAFDGRGIGTYSLDFGEEPTAFSSRALLKQTEFLVSMIHHVCSQAVPCILIGHSMGGLVVSQALNRLGSTQQQLAFVHLISSPLAGHPAGLDWPSFFLHNSAIEGATTSSVPVRCWTGGIADSQVLAQTTGLDHIVGGCRSMSTASMPGVFAPVSHVRVLFCAGFVNHLLEATAVAFVAPAFATTPVPAAVGAAPAIATAVAVCTHPAGCAFITAYTWLNAGVLLSPSRRSVKLGKVYVQLRHLALPGSGGTGAELHTGSVWVGLQRGESVTVEVGEGVETVFSQELTRPLGGVVVRVRTASDERLLMFAGGMPGGDATIGGQGELVVGPIDTDLVVIVGREAHFSSSVSVEIDLEASVKIAILMGWKYFVGWLLVGILAYKQRFRFQTAACTGLLGFVFFGSSDKTPVLVVVTCLVFGMGSGGFISRLSDNWLSSYPGQYARIGRTSESVQSRYRGIFAVLFGVCGYPWILHVLAPWLVQRNYRNLMLVNLVLNSVSVIAVIFAAIKLGTGDLRDGLQAEMWPGFWLLWLALTGAGGGEVRVWGLEMIGLASVLVALINRGLIRWIQQAIVQARWRFAGLQSGRLCDLAIAGASGMVGAGLQLAWLQVVVLLLVVIESVGRNQKISP